MGSKTAYFRIMYAGVPSIRCRCVMRSLCAYGDVVKMAIRSSA